MTLPIVGAASNPYSEIIALAANITIACTGVLTRTVTVLSDPVDNFYEGTYPMIAPGDIDWRLDRLQGGNTGIKGQAGNQPSIYGWTLEDVVDPRGTPGVQVATARNDLLTLVAAIAAYFDVAPHRCLPVSGVKGATLAGEHIRMRYRGPFQAVDGGEIRVVVGLSISVVGLPHQGTLT